jgi:UDP-hydrolysing UDP-N-acetyl-D-glucosamine 2-epimerase
MGEEPWRVFVTGDPGLDLLRQMRLLNRIELRTSLGVELKSPVLLVTFHPATLDSSNVLAEVESLLMALSRVPGTLILTYPNADAESRIILDRLRAFVAQRADAALFSSLGQLKYYSLLGQADLMVGNSSSGFWEAPSFRLPVVNIGDRQRGRFRPGNVLDSAGDADSIYAAIQRGLAPEFRAGLCDLQNPWGDGQAALRVVAALKGLASGPQLLQKRFVDLRCGEAADGANV